MYKLGAVEKLPNNHIWDDSVQLNEVKIQSYPPAGWAEHSHETRKLNGS